MFELFCREVGPIPVGIAARSSFLTLSMGEKLLRLHMTKESDIPRAQTIAKSIAKGFFHHSYPLGRKEAQEINLEIAPPDEKVESLMWRIWQDIELELEVRDPFSPIKILMSSKEAPKLLKPAPLLNIPPNLPPDQVQAMIDAVVNAGLEMIEPVGYQAITAMMESNRYASREIMRGKILASRSPGLDIVTNAVMTQHAWNL